MIRLLVFFLAHESSIKLMFALNIVSLVVLTVLHHFMKNKHHKLWVFLCGIPLIVMLLFYIKCPGCCSGSVLEEIPAVRTGGIVYTAMGNSHVFQRLISCVYSSGIYSEYIQLSDSFRFHPDSG